MLKRYKVYLIWGLILITVLFGSLGVNSLGASAKGYHQSATQSKHTVSPGKRASGKVVFAHDVNMQDVPKESSKQASTHGGQIPLQTGVSPAVYAQRKAAAAHFKGAVRGTTPYPAPVSASAASKAKTNTPVASTSFNGMSNSAATCPYFGGCQPPDMALAASFSWVLQGVNTSYAVYNLSGTLQAGWPKTAQSFFGIANPGSCDPNGPFLSDPRAFYDQNDNRFWTAIEQVEGVPGKGANCPFLTLTWIAVSVTGNPNGSWHIYAFDMSFGSGFWGDYTGFGFDQQGLYYSGNMFNSSTIFQYAEYCGVRKHMMENGQSVTNFCFIQPSLGGVLVDTMQPALGESLQVGSALGGQFISSENINFGGGQCVSGCSGVVVWSMSNPGFSTESVSGFFVSTSGYSLAPAADQPSCNGCIETLDTRISGTPTWQRGMITFGLETNINNGVQNVPGIFWGQIFVSLNDNGSISSASVFQSGYFFFSSGVGSGDTAASFGALGSDGDGDLYMVYEFMGHSFNPSVVYSARRNTFSLGLFHDAGFYLRSGDASTFDSRWGDYEAFSPAGVPFTNDVWFAGEYATSTGDWSTFIGHDKFVAGQS